MDILLYDQDAEACHFWRNLAETINLNVEVEELWRGPERLPQCPIIVVDQAVVPHRFASEIADSAQLRPHQSIVATGRQLQVADVVQIMRGGVDFVFEKPLVQQDVSSKIGEILESVKKKQRQKQEFEQLQALFSELTSKEKDVLDFVLKGVPNKKTAEELKVSVRTIEARRAKVYLKTTSACVAELVRKVDRLQFLSNIFSPPKPEPATPTTPFNAPKMSRFPGPPSSPMQTAASPPPVQQSNTKQPRLDASLDRRSEWLSSRISI